MKTKKFGVGDKVKILHCSNMMLIGQITEVASICGTEGNRYYHLKIDGEQRAFIPQNLELVENVRRIKNDLYGRKNLLAGMYDKGCQIWDGSGSSCYSA